MANASVYENSPRYFQIWDSHPTLDRTDYEAFRQMHQQEERVVDHKRQALCRLVLQLERWYVWHRKELNARARYQQIGERLNISVEEVYHRAIKQFTGIEHGQLRLERSQRNHIGLALRAYVRLEL